tara:strand:+ start:373 stop:552 length:180 start_codon:yes stop_codon:yes gene_type:complete
MENVKLNDLLMELRANQAESEVSHYEAMRRIDTRSRWMGFVVTANCVLLSVLLLKLFSG